MNIIAEVLELLSCIIEALGSSGKMRWSIIVLAVIAAFLVVSYLLLGLTGE